MNNNGFDPSIVRDYLKRLDETHKHIGLNYSAYGISFNTKAILAYFDKNADGRISKKEFSNITKAQYEKFKKDLDEYNSSIGNETKRIISYESLADFVDDGVATATEIDGQARKFKKIKETILPEDKTLKDPSQMTIEEMEKELLSYGVPNTELQTIAQNTARRTLLLSIMHIARKERAIYDKNSSKVDWHVGTYMQGAHAMCTFLALLDTYSDEKLKELYIEKKDEKGQKYYEVRFPQDANTGKVIVITEKELKDFEVSFTNEEGETYSMTDFSRGDNDITLMEMAFLKRFGPMIFKYGEFSYNIKNIFQKPEESKFVDFDNLKPEDFKNLPPNSTVDILSNEEIRALGLSKDPFLLKDKRRVTIKADRISLSDGTNIRRGHSFSVRRYDPEKEELIISGNELTNNSELRVPIELARFFQTCKLETEN